jgi:methylenetetrahydrofolate dehydrogenase (NADP+)/methenyltetrahydrofolate cyclohydrolase
MVSSSPPLLHLFPGQAWAATHEPGLALRTRMLSLEGKKLKIAAILFTEDQGSQLYTRLKQEAAQRVGIEYQVHSFSLRDAITKVQDQLRNLAIDPSVTGVIIQKPWRQTWLAVQGVTGSKSELTMAFNTWWQSLVQLIGQGKDVDGLRGLPAAPELGNRVLPATGRAVVEILNAIKFCRDYGVGSPFELPEAAQDQVRTSIQPLWPVLTTVAIIGKSDLLGYPLTTWLQAHGLEVKLMGQRDLQTQLETEGSLQNFEIVVSATGQAGLLQAKWLSPGGVVVDVGEPKGDLDRTQLAQLSGWVTPVPGGVGPLTVVSLLENCLDLVAT